MRGRPIDPSVVVVAGPAREFLQRNARVRRFAAGQHLWRAGEPAEAVHVLLSGTVHIVRHRGDRVVLIHSVETEWQIFGEVPLLTGMGYPASAVAATEGQSLVVSMATLRETARHDPTLMESMMRGLAHRLNELVTKIEVNTLASIRLRLALYLRSEGVVEDGEEIVSFGSHQALADIVGTVREVVAREMAQFRDEGLIVTRGRGKIAILDRDGIDRILELES